MNFLSNRKSLMKLGKLSLTVLSIVSVAYFVYTFVIPAFAANWISGTPNVTTSTSPDKWSQNGTAEWFYFDIVFTAGANVTMINLTVPNVTTSANFSVANTSNVPTINMTGWGVNYSENYTAGGFDYPRTITFNVSATENISATKTAYPSVRISVYATPIITESGDIVRNDWNVSVAFANTSETTLNSTLISTWVDSKNPVLNTTTPANLSYIAGNNSQLFQVYVYDSNFDVTRKNSSLYYRGRGADSWTGSEGGMSCNIQISPQFICNTTVNSLFSTYGEGAVIEYFFNASDNTTNTGYNGTTSNPLNVTIDRTAPTNTSTAREKVASGSKYDTANTANYFGFEIDWTDSASGVSTVLFESNFTGGGDTLANTTATKSGNTYYVNFSQSNFKQAGGYKYRWFANDSLVPTADANWAVTSIYYYTIAKADNPVDVYLNDTLNSNIEDLRYPTKINATGTTTAGELVLYRNVSGTWTDVSLTENKTNVTLPVGAHGYTVNTSGNANYSANNSAPSFYALVSQGATAITLHLNKTAANMTIYSGMIVNITALADNDQGVVWIYNGTDIANQSSGAVSSNATAWTGVPGTEWNITGYYNGSQNYTASSPVSYYIKVETTPPTFIHNFTNVTSSVWGKYQGVIGVNAQWNDNFNLSRPWIYNNTTGSWTNTYIWFDTSNVTNFTINPSAVSVAGGNVVIQAILYANDTSNNSNYTNTYTWTIDGVAPTLSSPSPSNQSYISRNNSYPFKITATDYTLNVTNATVYWKKSSAGAYSSGVMTCTGTAPDFTCLKSNVDLSIYAEGDLIYYYFEASDNSSLMTTSGSSANPYVVTLDISTPKYASNGTNVTVVGRYDGVLIYANWTDASLDYALLETNESGTATNQTVYGSPYNINSTAGQTWSNFTWSNTSLTPGAVVLWRIFANDTTGLSNVTENATFSIDNTKPIPLVWEANTTNDTTIPKGMIINITANWSDNIGLISRGQWWVWYNDTSTTGVNRSFTAFTANNMTNVSFNIGTSNFTAGIIFQARFYANDTSNNTNSSEMWQWTIDGTKPTWSQNITNVTNTTTIAKGTVINLTANWTDNINLDKYWSESNETGSWVNGTASSFTTGNLSDSIINTAGSSFDNGEVVSARIYANDTSNNTNVTGTFYWTIDGTAPTQDQVLSTNTTFVNASESVYLPSESYYFNISLTDNINISTVLFEWNLTNETASANVRNSTGGNFTVVKTDLPVSTANYSFKWYANDTSNNWVASNLYYFNITRNASTSKFVGLALNGTEANVTYTYPAAVNATAWRNFTETGNLSLWKEGAIVDSTLTASSRSQDIRLANGTYNYTLTFTSTNYTDVSITTNRFALVNKGLTNISLFINGTEGNATMSQGSGLNITAAINTTYSVTLMINTTIVGGWVNQSTTGTRIENTTSTSSFTVADNYNMTVSFGEDANYTADSQTWWLNITQDLTGPTVKFFDDGLNAYGFNNTTARKSGATINLNISVTDAGIGMTSNEKCFAKVGSGTAENFANYSSGWCNGTVTIPSLSSGAHLLNITVNDTNDNMGVNDTYYLTVDNVPPVIAISSPANSSYNKMVGRVWINGTVSDNLQMSLANISVNDSRFAVYNFTKANGTTFAVWNTSAVTDGLVDITINYTDNATNTGNASVSFYEDNTGPSAVYGLTNSSSQYYAPTTSQTIQVRVDDALQTNATVVINYYINGSWFSATLTGTPGTSTTYSGSISTVSNTTLFDAVTGKGYMVYYITGVDNATNSISNGGSVGSPLANLTFSTTGAIDGYALKNGTTTGISGATVSDGTRAAVSNTDGYYVISNVPAGTYTVTVSAINYTTNTTSSVSVTAGATTRANVTMAYVATGVIQGYVYLTNTSIVPNATASITVSDGTRTATPNSAGFYQILNVPAGTYILTVSGVGYWVNTTSSVSVTAGTTTSQNNWATGAENFNVTIPGTVGSSNTGFFDTGWHQFFLSTQVFSSGTSNYTIASLFTSVTGNYSIIYRYNSSLGWTSYVPGAGSNDLTFVNSTSDQYYINMNATDRIEIERRY